ncbi:hypothetical protein SAMN02800694_3655 [Luteibacter sp. UNCMF331Sha3.1]|uniref:hypothetical protein n=1 Tax=Luteibacter sp. UNCMF331Sha3.1 TaxID=1502760 RepID=UPI0008BBA09D|nr:hypothetical protein [Luteibacter sp. UNCMF331Sha3.1]SEN52241.1 hypothetical protein SAMN02800694_3655 [Luteibacter sp. UNCMF331Sha3.1]
MQRVSFANVSYWDRVPVPHVRCFVCHPENDDFDPEEGCRPSQLRRIHKCAYANPGQELYLRAVAEQLREQGSHDEQDWPEPGHDSTTGLRCKPKSSWRLDAYTPTLEQPAEDDAMKRRNMAMAAALAVGVALPAAAMHGETKQVAAEAVTPKKVVTEPVWPDNGIAQRELGDGTDWLEDLFVEHVGDEWIAWAVMRPPNGQTVGKAINFFTGDVLDVTGDFDSAYVGSFIDAKGVEHKETLDQVFDFKDPRPGGGLGEIDFAAPYLEIPRGNRSSIDLRTYRREAEVGAKVIWSKVAMYRCVECPDSEWEAFFSTALNLRDGTMLVSGGKYVFRLRMDDFSPVGRAPALHVFDEADVQRAIDDAKARQVENVFDDVLKALHLD